MSLPAPVSIRLSKLLPLLGSDKDGEVLSAARAIERTLQSAGRDLHDLAQRLVSDWQPKTRAYEPPRPHSSTRRCPRWERLSPEERVVALDMIGDMGGLSPWEREFIRSIDGMLRRGHRPVTPKQAQILNDLLGRAQEARR